MGEWCFDKIVTLQGTHISHQKMAFWVDDFPFPVWWDMLIPWYHYLVEMIQFDEMICFSHGLKPPTRYVFFKTVDADFPNKHICVDTIYIYNMVILEKRRHAHLKGVASSELCRFFTAGSIAAGKESGRSSQRGCRDEGRRCCFSGGLAGFFSKMWVWLHVKSIPWDLASNFKVVMSFIELFVWEDDFPRPCRTLLPLFWPSQTMDCYKGIGGVTYFVIFIPMCGNDPIWLIFFRWVETTN